MISANRAARKELYNRHGWDGDNIARGFISSDERRRIVERGSGDDRLPLSITYDVDRGTILTVTVEKVEPSALRNASPEALRSFLEEASETFRDEVKRMGGKVKFLKGHLLKMAQAVFENRTVAVEVIAREAKLAAEGKTGLEGRQEQLIIEYAKSSRSTCTLTLEDPRQAYDHYTNKFIKIREGTLRIGLFIGERTMPDGKVVQFHQWYTADAFFDRDLRKRMAAQRADKNIFRYEVQKKPPDPEVPASITHFKGHEVLKPNDRARIEELMVKYHQSAPAPAETGAPVRKRHRAALDSDED